MSVMSQLDRIETDLRTAQAGLAKDDVTVLREKLETVKAALRDPVPAEDKVRWLRGYLGA